MAEKRNDGSDLENLVALVERAFVPRGFSIEQRKPVFNDDGVQTAELDILVSGPVGSVQYTMLVECRDRPSSGAAPVSWIEQLFGRRTRMRLDTVVAVSTTGFAPGAIEFAAKENIRLRDFTRLEYEDVCSWLPFFSPMLSRTANLLSVRNLKLIQPDLVNDPSETDSEFIRIHIEPRERKFLHHPSGTQETITEMWYRLVSEQNDMFDGLLPDGIPISREVEASSQFLENYSVELEQGSFKIDRLTFDAEVCEKPTGMPLISVADYGGTDTPGRTVAHWSDPDGVIRDLYIILTKKEPDQS